MNEDKPKSKFLQDRRSKLLSVLNKVCKQNTASVCETTSSIVEIPDDPIIVKSETTSPPSSPELTIVHDTSEMVKEGTQDQKESSHSTTISPESEYEHNDANIKLEDPEEPNFSEDKAENHDDSENIDDDFQSCAGDDNPDEYYCDDDNLDNHNDSENINQDETKEIGINTNDEKGINTNDEEVLNSNTNSNNEMEEGNQIEENDKRVDNNDANSEEQNVGESEDFAKNDECENNEANEVEQVMKEDSNKMETIIKNDGMEILDESKEKETSEHIEEDLEASASSMEPGSKEQFFRYLNVLTHDRCTQIIEQRLHKKKQLNVKAIDVDLLHKTPKNKKRSKKKLYLQQRTPPVTRLRSNASFKTQVSSDTNGKSKSANHIFNNFLNNEVPSEIKTEFQGLENLTVCSEINRELGNNIDKNRTGNKIDICIICQLHDDEGVICCQLCGEYYHLLCHRPGQLHVQKRMCPYCIYKCSPDAKVELTDQLKIKKEQRNNLLHRYRHLRYEVQDLDILASELCVKIKRQNYRHDQLLSDKVMIESNLKTLLNFVAQIKGQQSIPQKSLFSP
ncbi:putative uncharacterized protein DDB_G0274535 [Ctenocephalides felis]|uniref:putative uncharacterized protein DDB_G0274535 n=1 Tax=Ctenocephalides felis TaxID=7515 RepID=UPI000E6E19B2|nr:putative uncharacterized protein DDB_G0274535 [Ctenocephalides felis]